jgi:hypothetical protein
MKSLNNSIEIAHSSLSNEYEKPTLNREGIMTRLGAGIPNPDNLTLMGLSLDSFAHGVKELMNAEPVSHADPVISSSSYGSSSAGTSASSSPISQATGVSKSERLESDRTTLNISVPLYTIKKADRKGFGVFTTMDISRGTTIMMEEPLIHFTAEYTPDDIMKAYSDLPVKSQTEFMALASVHHIKINKDIKSQLTLYTSSKLASYPATYQRDINMLQVRSSRKKTVQSIFYANAMAIGDGAAIFKDASRINHSCVPNASYQWAPHNQAMHIRITKDIPADGEITICYIDPCNNTTSRKKLLLNSYAFKCNCPACEPTWDPNSFAAQSIERRWRLQAFGARDYTWDYGGSGTFREESDMLSIIASFEEEGLCVPQLGMAYTRLGEIYLSPHYKNVDKAIFQLEKAVEEFMVCLGPEFEQTKMAKKKLEEVKRSVATIF